MLKIILGNDYAEEKLGIQNIHIGIESMFNTRRKKEWSHDNFVKRIISEVDKSDIILDYAVMDRRTGTGYSIADISTGAKSLILVYEFPDELFCVRMGDNCTDLLEQIAYHYEKLGKDITIVTNYMHEFKFNYVDSIYYVNWGITCHSFDDIIDNVMDKWYEQDAEHLIKDTADEDDD